MTVEGLLAHLEGARRAGTGWVSLCPSHDDRSPSLAVAIGTDGRLLLYCRAGCATEDVVRALGLAMRDLFDRSAARPVARRRGGL